MKSQSFLSRTGFLATFLLWFAVWSPEGATPPHSAWVQGATDQVSPRLYVNRNAPVAGDGQSWETAFQEIQAAIDAAPASAEIWIAAATYTEEVSPTSGLSLIGGFIGSETDVAQRDWVANPTVIDVTGLGLRCMTVSSAEGVLVDGLTLTGGFPIVGNGYFSSQGGAVYLIGSSITVRHCILRDNQATESGGGVYAISSILRFEDTLFLKNVAHGVPIGNVILNGGTGAVRASFCDRVAFERCSFRGNRCQMEGSAIYVQDTLDYSLLVSDCMIENNTSASSMLIDPGAVIAIDGGRIDARLIRTSVVRNAAVGTAIGAAVRQRFIRNIPPIYVEDSVISENENMGGIEATGIEMNDSTVENNSGAGIHSFAFARIVDSEILDNGYVGVEAGDGALIETCLIEGNGSGNLSSFIRGGGLMIGGEARVAGCRIISNTSFDLSPAVSQSGGDFSMVNCLVAGNRMITDSPFAANSVIHLGGDTDEIVNCTIADNRFAESGDYLGGFSRNFDPSTFGLTNSIFWNGTQLFVDPSPTSIDITYCDLSAPFAGEGNLSEDPLFNHPFDGSTYDYRLPCNSPCIDAGSLAKAPPSDLDGILRPKGAGIDMGCYENCIYDLDGDGEENPADLVAFPPEWYEPTDRVNAVFDFVTGPGQSNRIDAADLNKLIETWR